jgi:hypothetical protein
LERVLFFENSRVEENSSEDLIAYLNSLKETGFQGNFKEGSLFCPVGKSSVNKAEVMLFF